MLISDVKLQNFRNYNEQKINLNKEINIFYGDNAQGKTNIIESIFMCAIGKSFRTNKDKELININDKFANIEVNYKRCDREGNIKIILSDKKDIYINGIKIKRLSELLGKINVVIFTPDDINILKNGPSVRRKFLDIMIGQLRPKYIYNLNVYNKILEQRNNYIKQIKFERKDENLLEIWDEKLAEYAEKIYNYRDEFIKKLKNKIGDIHKEITNNIENIDIEYKTDFLNKTDFFKKLTDSRKVDIIKGYTTKGTHRDDFTIAVNGISVNVYGSQGQHRTAVLSLKMAELKVIYDEIGENPILLLDDFMSELDAKRRNNFLNSIKNTQVIITCTDSIDLNNINYNLYNVINGKVYNQTKDNI